MRSIIAVIALLLLMFLYKIFFSKNSKESNGPSQSAMGKGGNGQNKAAMPVSVFVAKKENVANSIFSSGTLVANEAVELKSEISGRITQLFLKEGGIVTKGQLLAKIKDDDILAQLKKIKFEQELAKQIEARQQKLLDINAISKEEYDLALNKVNTLSADQEALEVRLRQTEIRAPFSGKIGLKNISVGAYVTPANTIASILQISTLKMDFDIPEKYFNQIKVGKKINFAIDGSSASYVATVIALDPVIDPSLRTLKVRCSLNNASGKFLPGMFIKVDVPLQNQSSIMIPSQAIIPFAGGKKVFVKKDGLAIEKNVISGLRTDEAVEIIEGITSGDSIILTGLMNLKPGQAVKSK